MTPLPPAKRKASGRRGKGARAKRAIPVPEDYRMLLPDWLDAETWDGLVEEATQNGSKTVTVYHGPDGKVILTKGKRRNIHDIRLDLHYCEGCGTRMGCIGELCPDCQKPPGPSSEFLSQSALEDLNHGRSRREKTVTEYLRDNPDGNMCSRCGRTVPSARGVACLCSKCTDLLARLRAKGYWRVREKTRTCPDCGGTLAKRRRYCLACAKRRRRKHDRAQKRKQRASVPGPVPQLTENRSHNPL